MSIKIPIEAKIDTADVSKATAKLVQQINALGKTVADANKVKFNPISKATLDDLKKVQAHYENLQKVSSAFNRRLQSTGQKGVGFFDLNWAQLYPDANARARAMRQTFEYVTGYSFAAQRPPQPPQPAQPPAPRQPASPGASGQAGRRILREGLRAAGPAGAVADNALSAGLSGGVVSGLAGLAGGLAALAVGKAIGAVREKIAAAEQESIQYDTLKRTLGDVNVGFNMLRESLRGAARDIDISFEESQRLGREFAKIAGVGPEGAKSLYEEIMVNGGFARAYGLDPSQSNNFFAQMREMGVTRNANDSRALALMIAEAIDKSGTFSKADEVLAAIANFATQQTRLGLTAANTSGYSSMLAGLVGAHIPGLDPQGAASMLARVNAAVQSGGAAGEAGQNFSYAAIAVPLGLDPIQARLLQEQGAFGTGRSTFGSGSPYGLFASRYNLGTPGTASGSDRTNLDLLLSKFREVYGDRPELMASALSNFFGINLSQAMALATTDPSDLSGIMGRLQRQGVDISRVNGSGIATLARVNSGGRSVLDEVASGLMGRTGSAALTDMERERLRKAQESGDDEQYRDVVAELVATREQEKTEGSETRRTIQGVQNEIQALAGKLVQPMNDIRSGILLLAGGGKMGALGINRRLAEVESDERRSAINARYSPLLADQEKALQRAREMGAEFSEASLYMTYRNQPDVLESKLRQRQAGIELQRNAQAEIDRLNGERSRLLAAEDARLSQELDEITANHARQGGGTPATDDSLFQALIQQESGGRHIDPRTGELLRSSAGALGITQLMPDTARNPGFGIQGIRDNSEAEYRRVGREYLQALLIKYSGDRRKALAAYNAGPGRVDRAIRDYGDDWLSSLSQETQDYVPAVLNRAAGYSTAMLPEAAGSLKGGGGSDSINLNLNVTGTLTNANGQPAGTLEPTRVNHRVGAPRPSGS